MYPSRLLLEQPRWRACILDHNVIRAQESRTLHLPGTNQTLRIQGSKELHMKIST